MRRRQVSPPFAADFPQAKTPALRKRLSGSLLEFCVKCMPEKFGKPFSKDHRKAIAKMEKAILEGGSFALAMPRGSGKTTLIVAAALWALLHGHKRYVTVIGADKRAASKLLMGIRSSSKQTIIYWTCIPKRPTQSAASSASPTDARARLSRAAQRTSSGPLRRSHLRRTPDPSDASRPYLSIFTHDDYAQRPAEARLVQNIQSGALGELAKSCHFKHYTTSDPMYRDRFAR